MFFVHRQSFREILLFSTSAFVVMSLPTPALAFTMEQVWNLAIVSLYGGVGFFGMVGTGWFLGGWAVYVARRGQEYRLEGLYAMAQGVRILSFVVIGALILYFFS